jgi:hypothetical protein
MWVLFVFTLGACVAVTLVCKAYNMGWLDSDFAHWEKWLLQMKIADLEARLAVYEGPAQRHMSQ